MSTDPSYKPEYVTGSRNDSYAIIAEEEYERLKEMERIAKELMMIIEELVDLNKQIIGD